MNSVEKTAGYGKLLEEFPPISTQEWEQLINADLKGADYEKRLVWKTIEGFDVKPYYRKEDIENLALSTALPGEYPYLRGYNKSHNKWEIRQDIPDGNFDKANEKALRAISRGANAIGFNIKDVVCAADLKKLLKGIDLAQTSLHFKSSISYSIFVAILIDYLRTNNIDKNTLKGSINFDHYAYYLLHGEYYNSLADNLNELRCLMDLMKKELPGLHLINVNGKIFHNSGGSVVQELAFSLAEAIEYLSELTDKGVAVSDILPRMRITLALGGNYFFEIAKIRAARYLFARIANEYAPHQEKLHQLFIHTETSLWNKSIYDPHVNILRTTTEAMSGAIAGANSICILPFDVAYSEGDEISNRIARNTQIILKEESYIDKIVDPAAGSYYIESITNSIAENVWALVLKIEDMGGFTKAMESGFVRDEINRTAAARNIDIALRRTTILGTNQYPNPNDRMLDKIVTKKEQYNQYLKVYRGAEVFEELRLATERHVLNGKKHPVVFLLSIGNLAMRKARASFATGFFGCAGYQIIDTPGFNTVEEGVNAALAAKADITVICSSDEEYAVIGPAAVKLLKEKAAQMQVFIAGNPLDQIEMLKTAGIDDFIHVRSNVVDYLRKCHNKLGIS